MRECRTFWGSHHCCMPRGHIGPCLCACCECLDHTEQHLERGCVAGPPYYGDGTTFYGEDAAPKEKHDAL